MSDLPTPSPTPGLVKLATRLYVDASLADGGTLALEADKAHFLGRVLRLAAGDRISVFNGRDGLWQAAISDMAKRHASLVLEQQVMAQPSPRTGPMLVMPPIKKNRADWLVEKATELGVAGIQTIVTEHTAVREVNLDRWRKITIEAAEQCERLDLPSLASPMALDRFLSQWPVDQPLHVAVERAAAPSLSKAVTKTPVTAIVIGPEGGFSPAELDQFAELPFVHAVSLGSQVLRTETAALAALAILSTR